MNWRLQTKSLYFAFAILTFSALTIPPAQAENCFSRFFSFFDALHEDGLARPELIKTFSKVRVGDQVQVLSKAGAFTGEVQVLNFNELKVLTAEKKVVTTRLRDLQDFKVLKNGNNAIDDVIQNARKKAVVHADNIGLEPLYRSPHLIEEMKRFRALPQREKEAYLRKVGSSVMEDIKVKHHTNRIGFHYNLHGGWLTDYIDAGGIKATYGDVALQYGAGDARFKVYYFDSNHFNLYEILDARHPDFLMKKVRMGNVLMPFDLNSSYFQKARAEKGILEQSSISSTFDDKWLKQTPMSKSQGQLIGVPLTEFLDTPMEVFRQVKGHKKLGNTLHPGWDELGTLSWDEMTLLEMRRINSRWAPKK